MNLEEFTGTKIKALLKCVIKVYIIKERWTENKQKYMVSPIHGKTGKHYRQSNRSSKYIFHTQNVEYVQS